MSDALKREIADKLSRLRLLSPEDMADQLLPVFSRVIVASFEEAAQLVKRWNFMCCSDADGLSADICALIPAKVRLRAEIRELERVEVEAKWWSQYFPLQHSPDCSYNSTDSPAGDFCDCSLPQRKRSMKQRLAAISQELAEKRERLKEIP